MDASRRGGRDTDARAATNTELAGRRAVRTLDVAADAQRGKQQLGDLVGFLEMRVARGDDRVDAERLVFPEPRRNRRGVADERRARAAADETDARPEVGGDDQPVALAATV